VYLISFEGSYYQGEWKNGKRHGKGRLSLPDKSYHEGIFEDDLPHGRCRRIHFDGEAYEGD